MLNVVSKQTNADENITYLAEVINMWMTQSPILLIGSILMCQFVFDKSSSN